MDPHDDGCGSPVRAGVEFTFIMGYPGYRVGSDGSVWSCKRPGSWSLDGPWYELQPNLRRGRPKVDLSHDGVTRTFSVATLVLTCFEGPRPDGLQCCHRDDNPLNNDLTNLRWDTPKANAEDRDRNGRTSRGERRPAAKLDEEKVRLIRRLRKLGFTQSKIATLTGVSRPAVGYVLQGKSWSHVQEIANEAGSVETGSGGSGQVG